MQAENVIIPKSHLIFLLPSYRTRKDEIKSMIKDLEEELKSIEVVLDSFKLKTNEDIGATSLVKARAIHIQQNKKADLTGDYQKEWVWIEKIIYTLKKFNRPMTTGEITRHIYEHEPDLNGKGRSISAVLSVNTSKPDGVIYKIESESGRDLYWLKDFRNNAPIQRNLLDGV